MLAIPIIIWTGILIIPGRDVETCLIFKVNERFDELEELCDFPSNHLVDT